MGTVKLSLHPSFARLEATLQLSEAALQASQLQLGDAETRVAQLVEGEIQLHEQIDSLQTEAVQNQVKLAQLEERCRQQAQAITKLEQEKLSLRGELSDKIERLIQVASHQRGSSIQGEGPRQSFTVTDPSPVSEVDILSHGTHTSWSDAVIVANPADVHSVQSAPGSFYHPQCLLPSSELMTPDGPVNASNLWDGMMLTTLDGSTVQLLKHLTLPARDRDVVALELPGIGSFQITADHLVLAKKADQQQYQPTPAKELSPGMQLFGSHAPVVIGTVAKLPPTTTEVVQFHLNDPTAMVKLKVGIDCVCVSENSQTTLVYGFSPCKGFCDVVEVSSNPSRKTVSEPWATADIAATLTCHDGFPLSLGSNGHPDCHGACHLYKKGRCKYSVHCLACHVPSCSKHKASPGKMQRARAKKRSSN